ncbi:MULTISPECIES: hypothetical protein [Methylobacterium]|uniref:Uncharacterized protein n=1 Tax=Methylobacterium bullatum TaxID=570505 RepID=A0AAV4Z2F1_9HYPH|nr:MULTISPECIES: hypothetical protein [Methylobacterium]MBD8902536.1 hypothetical protein [Methylobacterium bullatum]TXN28665.1 hypothetical protein FV220_08165 [Methylobacterium sp. WL19]GJD38081.1 hypothetical protein OICFNHDK_0521 [Methylobacterium bullatum]
MHLSVLLLSAVFALAMTDAGYAQATLPNDDVNIANNPGTVKDAPSARVEALDCTCRNTAPDAADAADPKGGAAPGDLIVDCSCRQTVPDTTGTVAIPAGPEATAPGSPKSPGGGSAPPR